MLPKQQHGVNTEVRRTTQRAAWALLGLILIVQVCSHIWLQTASAHSGQVAIPWMMNRGHVLFADLLEQHAPLSSVLAAVAQQVLPLSPLQVARALNLTVVLAITLLVFSIGLRVAGPVAAIGAALAWFWWEPVYANVLFYFDTLVGLIVTAALAAYLALRGRSLPAAAFLCGLLMGLATLAKQHAWLAAALFALYGLRLYGRAWLPYLAGAAILPGILVGWMIAQHTLDAYVYWNWTFNFSGLMDSSMPDGEFIRKWLLCAAMLPGFLLLAPRRGRDWVLIGLLWLATMVTMLPRFSLSHVTAQLPMLALASGLTLAALAAGAPRSFIAWRSSIRDRNPQSLILAGLLAVVLAGALYTGVAARLPSPLGRGLYPGYDEFNALAEELRQQASAGDTLFVLPELDSTPQIHVLAEMMPPGTWVKGWRWYLRAPAVVDTLLREWTITPPTFVVVFPEFADAAQPEIQPLLAFVAARYTETARIADVLFHGDALIYRLADDAPAG